MVTQEEWDKMKSKEHYSMYCELDKRIKIVKLQNNVLNSVFDRIQIRVKNLEDSPALRPKIKGNLG